MREVLRRDGYRCRECGRVGKLEVDHIQPLDLGGAPWDAVELFRSLCIGVATSPKPEPRTPGPPALKRRLWGEVVSTRVKLRLPSVACLQGADMILLCI